MKIIGKSEKTIVGDIINTKDVYYCRFGDVYTAFKFKEFKVKFIITKERGCYDAVIELSILTAFDGEVHTIIIGKTTLSDAGLRSKLGGYGDFKYYISKENVKNGKNHTLMAWQIYENVIKAIKDFGVFSCWKWDDVKAVKASRIGPMPSELVGVNFITYDLLTDLLTSPTNEILCFFEERGDTQLIYLLRCDCENDNIIKIYDFE